MKSDILSVGASAPVDMVAHTRELVRWSAELLEVCSRIASRPRAAAFGGSDAVIRDVIREMGAGPFAAPSWLVAERVAREG